MNGQATSIAQQMFKAYQREIAGLNASLYAANDKINTLTFDLDHANNMRKTMQSSQVLIRERYHARLEDVRLEFAELDASLKEAMGQINTANKRLTETQAELANTKERVSDGNKDIAAARLQIGDLKSEVAGLKRKLGPVTEELEAVKKALASSEKRVERVTAEHAKCAAKYASVAAVLNSTRQAHTNEFENLSRENAKQSESAVNALKEQLEATTNSANSTRQKLVDSIAKMRLAHRAEVKALEAQLAEAKSALSKTKLALSETKLALSERKSALSETKSGVSENKAAASKWAQEKTTMFGQLESLSEAFRCTHAELGASRDQIKALSETCHSTQASLAAAFITIKDLETNNTILKENMKAVMDQLNEGQQLLVQERNARAVQASIIRQQRDTPSPPYIQQAVKAPGMPALLQCLGHALSSITHAIHILKEFGSYPSLLRLLEADLATLFSCKQQLSLLAV
ncbi:hypothetical protein BJ741DRAFT_615220 [Chytriomyces cf. hyalinus JEL632]|nr:hypothetical protein BJ741DRAFT_615220 [Chytriomyces cf. hyalinus JEL632]